MSHVRPRDPCLGATSQMCESVTTHSHTQSTIARSILLFACIDCEKKEIKRRTGHSPCVGLDMANFAAAFVQGHAELATFCAGSPPLRLRGSRSTACSPPEVEAAQQLRVEKSKAQGSLEELKRKCRGGREKSSRLPCAMLISTPAAAQLPLGGNCTPTLLHPLTCCKWLTAQKRARFCMPLVKRRGTESRIKAEKQGKSLMQGVEFSL